MLRAWKTPLLLQLTAFTLGHFLSLFPGYSVAVFQLSHLLTLVVFYSVTAFACEIMVTMAGVPASEGQFTQRSNESSVNRIGQLLDPEQIEAAGLTSHRLGPNSTFHHTVELFFLFAG